jgi:hypothetical protein
MCKSHGLRVSVALVVAIPTNLPCFAAAPPTSGFYLGGGVGETKYDVDFTSQVDAAYQGSAFNVVSASRNRSQDLGGKVYGGYQSAIPAAIGSAT